MKREIPYGVINWEKLVNEYYVVDNTSYVRKLLGRTTPDEETVAQAKHYRESLPRRPGWRSEIVTYVVEVYSRRGYNWFEIA